ncbi:hypothetical protein M0804_004577 [Polistes exclamans]|nr:hypothetical protein M0804_004577 [Polistes exclamans]
MKSVSILLFAVVAALGFLAVNAEGSKKWKKPPGRLPKLFIMRSTILIQLVAAIVALGFFGVNGEPVANPWGYCLSSR